MIKCVRMIENETGMVPLREGERIDDLEYKGLRLIQREGAFCFGTDAVLLANFVVAHRRDRVLDLGTGTGIIPILLAGRTKSEDLTGIEIQPEMAEMAARSVALNGLEGKVRILCNDLRELPVELGKTSFQVVVCNPPYRRRGSGEPNTADALAVARHEVHCTLEDVVRVASEQLMNKGRLYLIHQAERMVDIISILREAKLEPKRLRLVYPRIDRAPNLILIEAVKGAGRHLRVLPPLIVQEDTGEYTPEMKRIYHIEGADYE